MADLTGLQAAQTVKIAGSDSSGVETNFVDATTNGLKVEATGNVASASTDSGNPVKVAGVYNATKPTFTNGQRADLQVNMRGELVVHNGGDYTRIAGATTVTVKSSAGILKRIVINRPTNGTATVYDNTTGAGTVIALIAYTNGTAPTYLEYNLNFSTGLTIVTTGTNTDLTVVYR